MKIFLSNINESWIIDRVRKEWYTNCPEISTNQISNADIVWIISPWVLKGLDKKELKKKKVLCSYYHFDFKNFSHEEFEDLDQYVDEYHVICEKTKADLQTLTNKKITSIPFWINQNIFFQIDDKISLRRLFGVKDSDYLIGSFQRDTEGSDLISPKLIKGPDIFLEIVKKIYERNKSTKVVLSGTRRQYIITNLSNMGIPFIYYEMVDFKTLNKLYNLLDLYVVSSRIEGGPQAILECGVTKTPLVSTDVGVAPEILSNESIYKVEKFNESKPDVDFAYEKSKKYLIPNGIKLFEKMFVEFYES